MAFREAFEFPVSQTLIGNWRWILRLPDVLQPLSLDPEEQYSGMSAQRKLTGLDHRELPFTGSRTFTGVSSMAIIPMLSIVGRKRPAVLLGRALCLGLIVGMAGDLAAQTNGAGDSLPVTGSGDSRLAAFDTLMTGFLRDREIPGAALTISRHGRVVHSRGYGYADVEQKLPVQPDSLFRIASISKPITAVAIMQLVERGKVDLEDKIVNWVQLEPHLAAGSQYDRRINDITIRQLLQHTAGWDRDVSFDPMFRSVEIAAELKAFPPAMPGDVIRYMYGRRLDFDPGARFAYSNLGYCLLGRVIEQATGQNYEELVRQRVLEPIGIQRMRLGKTLPEGRVEGEVKYYVASGATGEAVMGPDVGKQVSWPYGAWCLEAMDSHGAWIASAPDLIRFAAAFDDPSRSPLLKRETIETMFARPGGAAGFDSRGQPKISYCGCGWFVKRVGKNGEVNRSHTGSLDGTSTLLLCRPDGTNIAVLFNIRNGSKERVPSRAIAPLLELMADQVTEWPEMPPAAAGGD